MRMTLMLSVVVTFAACDSPAPKPNTQTGTAERAAHDSMIAKSQLPGAGAVGKSLGTDSIARARVEMLDSIR
jgi:hypothetical protein